MFGIFPRADISFLMESWLKDKDACLWLLPLWVTTVVALVWFLGTVKNIMILLT